MTWLDRTNKTIELRSPGGDRFTALWIENERTLTKKLGIFELPDKVGAVVQDLDVGAYRHPITIYFDGPDNDLEAERFMKACEQKGEWSVTHPVKGALSLQLMAVSERISPTNSGNVTLISCQWIEPRNEHSTLTTSDLSQQIRTGIDAANDTGAAQFTTDINQDKAVYTSILEIGARVIVALVNQHLAALYNSDSAVSAAVQSVQRGIESTILEETIDTDVLAAQVQTLIQLPAEASTDLTRAAVYGEFIAAIIATGPAIDPTADDRNGAAMKELALVACVCATANISITSDILIRTQSIGLIESNALEFTGITDFLDDSQEIFQTSDIDLQYFSQSESYSDTVGLTSDAAQFLLIKSFDLAIEKRFLLASNEAPIFTTIREYGTVDQFDFFIETNNLKGNDILLMKSGREVVVYV